MFAEPVLIQNKDDLNVVINQMKISAGVDEPLEQYTKTEEEVEKLLQNATEIQSKRGYIPDGGNRLIILDGEMVSLGLTTDDYHDYQWHISMCRVQPGYGLVEISQETSQQILNEFFSDWKSIENPGMMKEISHFVGND